jgi:uncharacterized SAM-binding protein YcdF (DUF218 family)
MLRRALAILALVLVAALAVRLAVGVVVGFVSAVAWILVAAALVAAVLWARSTLKSAERRRAARRPSPQELTTARGEDPVALEMRRISEQIRTQDRRSPR